MRCWALAVIAAMLLPVASKGRPDAVPSSKLEALVRLLTISDDVELQRDVLRGMHQALQGRREVKAPAGWSAVYRKLSASKDAEVREKSLVLSVLFGDPLALAALRKTAADLKAPGEVRRTALQTLVEKRADGTLPLLRDLLAERAMRGQALRGLAVFNDANTPALVLKHYSTFSAAEKADAVATLASRPSYGLALLDGMERKVVARSDVTAFTARQLASYNDKRLTAKLNAVWGSIRAPAGDRAKQMARYLGLVKPAALKKANRSHGRFVWARTCASCHKLFGEGGSVGPELTGAQRTEPEYILSKVLDPNAVVARDYQVTLIVTKTGRNISGIVKREDEKVVTLQTPTEIVRVAKSDIEERQQSKSSIMPEGQLAMLRDTEVRDLIAYLAGPGQVPLPKGAIPAKP